MAYRHKLSCRLALLRDVLMFVVPVAAAATYERSGAPPTGPASRIVQVIVVPESVTLDPAQHLRFVAYGSSATGPRRATGVATHGAGGPLFFEPRGSRTESQI